MTVSLQRIVARYLQGRTTPLPTSFPKTEIGLMTAEEFLRFRNPGEKHHPSSSYDFDLFKLNHEHPHIKSGRSAPTGPTC